MRIYSRSITLATITAVAAIALVLNWVFHLGLAPFGIVWLMPLVLVLWSMLQGIRITGTTLGIAGFAAFQAAASFMHATGWMSNALQACSMACMLTALYLIRKAAAAAPGGLKGGT